MAFAAVLTAAFAVVSAIHTLVDDDPLRPAMLAMAGVMDGHRMPPSERMMIEPSAVVVDDAEAALV